MKKILALASALIILGAGCSSSNPQNSNPQNNNGNGNGNTTVDEASAQPASYTLEEIALANTDKKCWTTVSGKVYDLTSYLTKHPGGKQEIIKACGKDSTAMFNSMHGGASKPAQALSTLEIGTLK